MKKLLTKVGLVGLAAGAVGAIIGILVVGYLSLTLPKISKLEDYRPPVPSEILAKDGTVLASIGRETRDVANIEDIPKRIINAFLASEDDNFYNHSGVDYLGIARAMLANIKAGRVVQGGSTITQQVAKSLLLTREKSIVRKIKDVLLAIKIEKKLSKDEILYLYLNQVYLGGGHYGVKAAIKGYFGKDLEEATIAEAAMIAGLLVAPGRYSPYIKPKAAYLRQRYVLKRLYVTGKITEAEYKEALNEKLQYRIRKPRKFKAPYFTEWVRLQIVEKVGKDAFLTGGFRVETTLDWDLQQVAEKEVKDGVKKIDKRQGYKGPLGNIGSSEEQIEFYKEQRTKIYLEASNFFTINEGYQREYEISYDEDEVEKLLDQDNEWILKSLEERVLRGNNKNSKLIPHIEKDKTYEALVEKIDNSGRIIFAKIGGERVIIPYENFRWAHERVISEKRKFFPYVTRPSTILKPGDKILVKVLKKEVGIYKYSTSALKKYIDDSKVRNELKSFRYILGELDQEAEAQAALVSINPNTGELISLVGGSDFDKNKFNRAIQSNRQPGSSFKPILFAAALENGFRPNSIIMDSPEALGGADSTLNWKPRNYDGKFKGPITFRESLEQSRNVPTIKIAQSVGIPKMLEFAKRIKFNAKLDEDLSLSLGSFGVTLMEMVSTYAIFPSGGRRLPTKYIISITDRDGKQYFLEDNKNENSEEREKEIEQDPIEKITEKGLQENKEKINQFHVGLGGDQVYDPRLAYIMTNILHGTVLYGTGRSAKEVSLFLGGKTGTTNSFIDAWFMGFSSNIVTGVWTGLDNNQTLGWGESGAKAALPIWKAFMKAGLKKYGEKDFKQPDGIINISINKKTGKIVDASDSNAFVESFVEGFDQENSEEFSSDTKSVLEDQDDYYNYQ